MKKIIFFSFIIILFCCSLIFVQSTITLKNGKTQEQTQTNEVATQDTIIQGNMVFDDYEQGIIQIVALKQASTDNENIIIRTTIDQPGPYQMLIPAKYSEVFIVWFNDIDNDGPHYEPYDPSGWLDKKKPLKTNKPLITGVDLIAQESDLYDAW